MGGAEDKGSASGWAGEPGEWILKVQQERSFHTDRLYVRIDFIQKHKQAESTDSRNKSDISNESPLTIL